MATLCTGMLGTRHGSGQRASLQASHSSDSGHEAARRVGLIGRDTAAKLTVGELPGADVEQELVAGTGVRYG